MAVSIIRLAGAIGALWLASAAQAQILVPQSVPYRDASQIDYKITGECTELGKVFSESIVKNGKDMGLDIAATEHSAEQAAAEDDYVDVRIDAAMSAGNAFIGHAKGVAASVRLLRNGEESAKQTFSRNSMGGFFGGFKSSCAVLNRTVNTLGKDVAAWLRDREAAKKAKAE